MYEFLRITHSILRYVILIGGIGAIVTILANAKARVKTFSLVFMVSLQVQFIIGILLYFFYTPWFTMLRENTKEVMKDKTYRFFAVEHIIMMIIAIALVSIGNGKVKKALKNNTALRPALILFIIALVVILAAIPWPFRGLGRGWL
jgi:dipeptide/tripeptide permease